MLIRMTALFFVALIVLTPAAQVEAQPLGDANAIAKAMKNKEYDGVLKLLSKYSSERDLAGNQSYFAGNEYILKVLRTVAKDSASLMSTPSDPGYLQGGVPPGIKPTVVVDALGIFIANRFKQELTKAFLEEYLKTMTEHRELQELFPTTYKLLQTADFFKPKFLLTSLRHTFHADLTELSSNLDKALITIMGNKAGEVPLVIRIALTVVDGLHSGKDAFEIASTLDKLEGNATPDVKNAVKLAAVMARSLINDNKTPQWKDVQALLKSSTAAEVFVGLVISREGKKFTDISLGGRKMETLFDAGTAKIPDELTDIFSQTSTLIKLTEHMEAARRGLEPNPAGFIGAGVEALEVFIELSEAFGGKVDDECTKYLEIAHLVVDIGESIQNQQYGAALANGLAIIEEVMNSDLERKKICEETLAMIAKHSTFAVNVVSAKDGKELAEVIETAALPVSSYRLKSERGFAVFLNAYGGILGGWNKQNDELIGPTAPVGIAVSTNKVKCPWRKILPWDHTTLFFPILDVGAVALIRVNDLEQNLPELKWENVITPGCYAYLGSRSLPLTLGFGVQYGPELVNIEGDTPTLSSERLRYGFVVAVDIPMFTLHAN